jgi:hypothetical protein
LQRRPARRHQVKTTELYAEFLALACTNEQAVGDPAGAKS